MKLYKVLLILTVVLVLLTVGDLGDALVILTVLYIVYPHRFVLKKQSYPINCKYKKWVLEEVL